MITSAIALYVYRQKGRRRRRSLFFLGLFAIGLVWFIRSKAPVIDPGSSTVARSQDLVPNDAGKIGLAARGNETLANVSEPLQSSSMSSATTLSASNTAAATPSQSASNSGTAAASATSAATSTRTAAAPPRPAVDASANARAVELATSPEARHAFFVDCLRASLRSSCRPREDAPIRMLSRGDWLGHVLHVLNATVRHRSVRWSTYAGYSGPWIENAFNARFLGNASALVGLVDGERLPAVVDESAARQGLLGRLERVFYPLVPLFGQWSDSAFGPDQAMKQPNKELFQHQGNPAGSPLRRDVLYVGLSQHDRGELASGVRCADYANVLTLSCGGWGNVALPLIKGTARHMRHEAGLFPGADNDPFAWQKRVRSRMFAFVGTNHLGRNGALGRFAQSTLPNKGGVPWYEHQQTPDWRGVARSGVFALAPRGYGRTSFRLFEMLQYGVVPLYLYDDTPWAPYQHAADFAPPGSVHATLTSGDALGVSRYGAVLQRDSDAPDAAVTGAAGSTEIESRVLNGGGMWGPGGVGFTVGYSQVEAFVCVACQFLAPGSAARWRGVRALPLHRYNASASGGECPCSEAAWEAAAQAMAAPGGGGGWVLPQDSLIAEMERRVASIGADYFTYDGVMGQVQSFLSSPLGVDSRGVGLRCVPKPDTYGTPTADPPFIERRRMRRIRRMLR